MAKLFNTDLKAYFSHFRKGIFVIVGLLTLGILIAASFFYGDRQATDKPVNNGTVTQNEAQEDTTRNGDSQAGVTNGNGRQGSENGNITNTGPQEIANAGPEDWAPVIAAMIGIMILSLKRSRKSLTSAYIEK